MELEKNAQKSHQNLSWDGLGLHFGRLRDGLGPLLGALGQLLAVSWPFKIKLFFSIGRRWAPRCLLERFSIDFGRDSGGFVEDLGGFRKELAHSCCSPATKAQHIKLHKLSGCTLGLPGEAELSIAHQIALLANLPCAPDWPRHSGVALVFWTGPATSDQPWHPGVTLAAELALAPLTG